VAFSIENKAIMNMKQKRLEKSQAKNPLYAGEHASKCDSKKAKTSRKNEDSGKTRTENDSIITEETDEFVGMTAKPGNKKPRTRFGLQTQAELHKQSVRKDKRRQKIRRNFDQQRQRMKEKMQDPKVSVKMQSIRMSEIFWSQNLVHLLLQSRLEWVATCSTTYTHLV
jgi:nucleolar protein 4